MTAEERFEATFEVGESSQLEVSNVRGAIVVQGGEQAKIEVVAVKHLEDCRDPEHTKVRLYQEGNRVYAETHYDVEAGWLGIKRYKQPCAVDYTIRVPSNCAVHVRQVKGTIQASRVAGSVNVDAVQGAVELHKISGQTQVKAVNATVKGDHWSGDARVNTVSGPVRIGAAHLSRLKANTVSADLMVETTLDHEGRYDFNSVSGDVTVYLPNEIGVESHGSTLSGHLVCDMPHEFSQRRRSGWRATINGGGPPLHFNSVSGDLEVLAAAKP